MKPLRPVIPHPTDPTLALVELTKGYFAVISAVDSWEVGKYNWWAYVGRAIHAGRTRKLSEGRGTELLHRFVATLAGIDVSEQVDHENRNPLDCRRSNLRAATHAQNRWNQKTRSDSKSGVKGVQWHRQTGKWAARLTTNGKVSNLGLFASIDEAARAVMAERERQHGEFAYHGTS
jgi:hypothetical protein